MKRTDPQNTPVLIVGAGPYGIAVAQELWHRGIEPVVVGDPFSTWHRHTLDIMDLRSDPRGSSVWSPDGRYDFPRFLRKARMAGELPDDDGETVPVSLYRRYLEEVVEALPFRLIKGLVTSLEKDEGGLFQARVRRFDSASGEKAEITAQAAVIATGLGGHQHLPTAFSDLPRERVLHSWDVDEIQRLDGRRVLVLGGGQSSAETVADLRRRNRVTWALKRAPLFFREPLRAPTPIFKLLLAGSSWIFRLPPAILRGISRATFRTTITPRLMPVWKDDGVAKLLTDADGLRLSMAENGSGEVIHCGADGQDYDVVVSATGYQFSLSGLPFLSKALLERLRESGDPPVIGSHFQSSVPGLFFVGGIAESTHGPAMRFVLGARHAAKTLGRTLPPQLTTSVDSRAA